MALQLTRASVLVACYTALYLLVSVFPVAAQSCRPFTCDTANVNACGGGSSGWHAVVEEAGACEVEGDGEAGVTITQQYLDVKITQQLYSEIEGLSVSAGDVVRLDFGIKMVANCTDATIRQTSACQVCAGEDWYFSTTCCAFEEGESYVLYADAITTTDGSESKDLCGTESRLALAAQSTCSLTESVTAPTDEDIDSVKAACTAAGRVVASGATLGGRLWRGAALLVGGAAAVLLVCL